MKVHFDPIKFNRSIIFTYYLDNHRLVSGVQEVDDSIINHPDWATLVALGVVRVVEDEVLAPAEVKTRKKSSKKVEDSVENYTLFDENV